MSKFSTNETIFTDSTLLVSALVEMGFKASEIEVNQSAVNLYGYQGDMRKDTAEIVIRRQAVNRVLSGGMSNDLGFKLQPNGRYGAVISAYDSSYANTEWTGKLSAAYQRTRTVQKMTAQGYRLAGTTKQNGKTQLQFVR